jgi:hypothetical protein
MQHLQYFLNFVNSLVFLVFVVKEFIFWFLNWKVTDAEFHEHLI